MDGKRFLWDIVLLVGIDIVSKNLVLNFEMNLVNSNNANEIKIIYYLLNKILNLRLILFNEILSEIKLNKKFDGIHSKFFNSIRRLTVSCAIENSVVRGLFLSVPYTTTTNQDRHLFKVRSAALATSTLPVKVSFEDYLSEEGSGDDANTAYSEALQLIERGVSMFGEEGIDGVVINGDLKNVKRTIIYNKIKMKSESFPKKYHKYLVTV